ncbi:hypothetical protein HZ993_07195 [Rhodoferax sp. AJA081-3]|uniref:DUF5677 domain-containing protein n=1 Tax=Rhodoferax sp. AJA081-3 TaxID=2752316 RepID=UPI001ADED1F6|nr:DUF5677 domain-containing protein [Rhodoferax sp. AJA081-3]QTN29595.1 hypothetical protein HZ993_07195 [Rhodoferax sp. AJA081-3]
MPAHLTGNDREYAFPWTRSPRENWQKRDFCRSLFSMNAQTLSTAVAHSREMDRLAVSELGTMQALQTEKVRIFAMATGRRALTYFRAVVSLVESNLYEPAGAVLRVLLELVLVLHVVNDSPEQLDVLAKQSLGENRKALKGLKTVSLDSRPEWLTDDSIEKVLSELTMEQSGFNAHYWADKSGNMETYNTMYRRLNAFSHASLVALDAYLPVNAKAEIIGVRGDVGRESGPQFLVSASSILLGILQIAAGEDIDPIRREKFTAMAAEQVSLQEQIALESDSLTVSPLS